ncbi:MAG: Lsr2 [Nonomuraea muscovyensis]|nr:Lsr2 [Nonomuraea muscovyensis]
MTVRALLALLDEIDQQGGPQAARDGRLHLPDHHQQGPEPMNQPTSPITSPAAEPQPLSVGQLLKWGEDHDDAEVQDQASRARVLLGGLRHRYAADQELTAITDERAQLEKRLAEIQAREAELAPPRKAGRAPTSPDTKAARAWAAENGIDCPPRGRVPKTVMDAWRAALPQASEPAA